MKHLFLFFITINFIIAQNKTIILYNEYNSPINNYSFKYGLDSLKSDEKGRVLINCNEKLQLLDDYYFTESYNCDKIKDLDTIIAYSMYKSLSPVEVKSNLNNKTLIYKFKGKVSNNIHFSEKYALYNYGMAAYYPIGKKYKNYKITEITFYINRSIKKKCLSELIVQPIIYELTEEKKLSEVHFPVYYKVENKISNVTMDISRFNYFIINPDILIGFKVFSIGKQKNKCDKLDMFEQSNFSIRASKVDKKRSIVIEKDGSTQIYGLAIKPDIQIKFEK